MKPAPKEIHVGTKTSLKRYTWLCKRNKTGIHSFQLIIPDFIVSNPRYPRYATVEDYYKARDEKAKKDSEKSKLVGFLDYARFYKCVNCGKRQWDSEKNPDKRIRQNVVK